MGGSAERLSLSLQNPSRKSRPGSFSSGLAFGAGYISQFFAGHARFGPIDRSPCCPDFRINRKKARISLIP